MRSVILALGLCAGVATLWPAQAERGDASAQTGLTRPEVAVIRRELRRDPVATPGPAASGAQGQPPWHSVTEVLRDHEWGDAINNLLDIVAAMPEAEYDFRPVPAMRSFGELVGHITDVQYGFCDIARGDPQKRESWEKHPAKAEVFPALVSSIALCDSAFDQLSDARLTEPAGKTIRADLFVTMLGHTRRETGKLVSYLRFRHVEPPEIHYQLGRKWRR